jgi:hypothetical protein
VNEILRNSGATPYFFDNPCALRIGGKRLALFLKISAGTRQAAPDLRHINPHLDYQQAQPNTKAEPTRRRSEEGTASDQAEKPGNRV